MNNNPLIVITTFNKLSMTQRCVKTVKKLGYDMAVVDDCSTDGTQKWVRLHTNLWPKVKRLGLTDSWNRAYKYFKKSDYSHLILMNNDVMLPDGAVFGMMSDYPLTVPLTNHLGAGYVNKDQSVDFHIDTGSYDPGVIKYLQEVQNLTTRGFKPVKHWTGFCMCFSRGIIKFEREAGNLIDPKLINVGNDDYLAKMVPAMLALGSFVYHQKGVSFNKQIGGRDDLSRAYN